MPRYFQDAQQALGTLFIPELEIAVGVIKGTLKIIAGAATLFSADLLAARQEEAKLKENSDELEKSISKLNEAFKNGEITLNEFQTQLENTINTSADKNLFFTDPVENYTRQLELLNKEVEFGSQAWLDQIAARKELDALTPDWIIIEYQKQFIKGNESSEETARDLIKAAIDAKQVWRDSFNSQVQGVKGLDKAWDMSFTARTMNMEKFEKSRAELAEETRKGAVDIISDTETTNAAKEKNMTAFAALQSAKRKKINQDEADAKLRTELKGIRLFRRAQRLLSNIRIASISDSFGRQEAIINAGYDNQLATQEDNLAKGLINEKEFNAAVLELKKKLNEDLAETDAERFQNTISTFANGISAFVDFLATNRENEEEDFLARLDRDAEFGEQRYELQQQQQAERDALADERFLTKAARKQKEGALDQKHRDESLALDRKLAIDRFKLQQDASKKSTGVKIKETLAFITSTASQMEAIGKLADQMDIGIIKTIGQAAVSAANAVASIPIVGPVLAIAAATAVFMGLKGLIGGFDEEDNDITAERWGRDAGSRFMKGFKSETKAPQFGVEVIGNMQGGFNAPPVRMRDTAPVQPIIIERNITLVFEGNVMDEEFVIDTVNPLLEQAVRDGESNLVVDESIITEVSTGSSRVNTFKAGASQRRIT